MSIVLFMFKLLISSSNYFSLKTVKPSWAWKWPYTDQAKYLELGTRFKIRSISVYILKYKVIITELYN